MNFDDLSFEQQRRLQAILSDPTLTVAEAEKEYGATLRRFTERLWQTWERPRRTAQPETVTSR